MKKIHLRLLQSVTCIIVIVGIISSGNLISEKKVLISNLNQTKKQVVYTKSLNYETQTTYNSSLPQGTEVTKEEGKNGLAYVNEKGENIAVIESPVNAQIEIGTGEPADYVGKMTGYGADCAGCSGNLACQTKDGNSYNLYSNGEYYNDNTYGSVRILAAALEKFPCGTIIKVENENLGTFNAIVLDTGGSMKSAWSRGTVHMDLAFRTETDPSIHLATSSNTKYSVQRWGY